MPEKDWITIDRANSALVKKSSISVFESRPVGCVLHFRNRPARHCDLPIGELYRRMGTAGQSFFSCDEFDSVLMRTSLVQAVSEAPGGCMIEFDGVWRMGCDEETHSRLEDGYLDSPVDYAEICQRVLGGTVPSEQSGFVALDDNEGERKVVRKDIIRFARAIAGSGDRVVVKLSSFADTVTTLPIDVLRERLADSFIRVRRQHNGEIMLMAKSLVAGLSVSRGHCTIEFGDSGWSKTLAVKESLEEVIDQLGE